jgi:hypothetical protein
MIICPMLVCVFLFACMCVYAYVNVYIHAHKVHVRNMHVALCRAALYAAFYTGIWFQTFEGSAQKFTKFARNILYVYECTSTRCEIRACWYNFRCMVHVVSMPRIKSCWGSTHVRCAGSFAHWGKCLLQIVAIVQGHVGR